MAEAVQVPVGGAEEVPMDTARSAGPATPAAPTVRVWVNRLVAVLSLPPLLAAVALISRVSPERGAALARRAVSTLARACGVRFVPDGVAAPSASRAVIVANHSSPMDIAALLDIVPDVRFLAAADLFRVPLLSAAMRGIGTISIERRHSHRARRQLDGIVEALGPLRRFRLVVFPEGGIPPAGERLPFKAGAFELAIRLGAQVLPVAIHGTATVLPPKGRLGVRPGTVRVELLPPIQTVGLTLDDLDVLRTTAERAVLDALGAWGAG